MFRCEVVEKGASRDAADHRGASNCLGDGTDGADRRRSGCAVVENSRVVDERSCVCRSMVVLEAAAITTAEPKLSIRRALDRMKRGHDVPRVQDNAAIEAGLQ